ncbi:MAG: HlyD family efflux transporter periplasmic adaptor subunit [Sphingomonadales bacterium]|nr:HlyD family efflux transporter periplasmic adaptor subunit [Sphingomonadales bacterium]MDE2567674.1 HlyD family efflux transporter periplasmic adaptor subunit [Sphingomonadales bacterium]
MKRPPIPVLVLAILAVVALAGWRLWPRDTQERWLGYVEGEPLQIAAPVSGTLASRAANRGASVKVGDALFEIDPVVTEATTAQAAAQVAAAQAQAADLAVERQRQPELDVSRAAEAAASAQLTRAQKDYDRYAALAAKGFVSRAQLDAARQARDVAAATLAQARAQLRSGELSVGRASQQQAASADVARAQAALAAQQHQQKLIAPVSPASGVIEQTYYNPGEWVPANVPVVSVLPADKRKLRFFVPEGRIAAIRLGETVHFTCDDCGGERTAKVSYIAPRAEYTPPVIYSERARSKLVFLVEAWLPADKPLPLGLPVSVLAK